MVIEKIESKNFSKQSNIENIPLNSQEPQEEEVVKISPIDLESEENNRKRRRESILPNSDRASSVTALFSNSSQTKPGNANYSPFNVSGTLDRIASDVSMDCTQRMTTTTNATEFPFELLELPLEGIEDESESPELLSPLLSPQSNTTELVDPKAAERERRRKELSEEIERGRRFYRDNFNYQILLNRDSFTKLGRIRDFGVGFRYENKIKQMNCVQLLVQLVNERGQVKFACRKLFFLECVQEVQPTEKYQELQQKYISKKPETLAEFQRELNEMTHCWRWILTVYRHRFLFIKDRILKCSDISSTELKRIQDYDDVREYCLDHFKSYFNGESCLFTKDELTQTDAENTSSDSFIVFNH